MTTFIYCRIDFKTPTIISPNHSHRVIHILFTIAIAYYLNLLFHILYILEIIM